jgi:hypothetical protein
LRVADEAGENVEVERFEEAGFEAFDRDRALCRDVGASFGGAT